MNEMIKELLYRTYPLFIFFAIGLTYILFLLFWKKFKQRRREEKIAIFILIVAEFLFCVVVYMTKDWFLILMAIILFILTIKMIITDDKTLKARGHET